jgi:ankyrin repeat protein
MVRYLLEKAADPQIADSNGTTPLHVCSCNGNVEIAQLLLKYRAQMDCKDRRSYTPLQYAADLGYDQLVSLFLHHLGDRYPQDMHHHHSALHLACLNGHVTTATILIDSGALVNSRGSGGNTPLHCACMEGHIDLAMMLLLRGAELHVMNEAQEYPVDVLSSPEHVKRILANNEHITTVLSSANKGTPSRVEDVGAKFTPMMKVIDEESQKGFHLACESGDTTEISRLLGAEIDLDGLDRDGCTGLYTATEGLRYEAVRLLLEKGANVNVKTTHGRVPLHAACCHGDLRIVKLLLDLGSDVKAIDMRGSTPLHASAENGFVYLSKMLLDRGANINARDGTRCSPLHLACANKQLMMATFLIEHGAIVDSLGLRGNTPLYDGN